MGPWKGPFYISGTRIWGQPPSLTSKVMEASRTPFEGSGKPEPLRHALSGFWSRRINEEHRMVYKVDGDSLLIAQLRYHY